MNQKLRTAYKRLNRKFVLHTRHDREFKEGYDQLFSITSKGVSASQIEYIIVQLKRLYPLGNFIDALDFT